MKRYIDDQWREILAGQGFSPRTEEGAEVWGSPSVDVLIEITHSEKGDPLWLFYINRMLVEKGDDSDRLLYLVEGASPEAESVKHEKEPNADDNLWLMSIGISVGEITSALCDGTQICWIDRDHQYVLPASSAGPQGWHSAAAIYAPFRPLFSGRWSTAKKVLSRGTDQPVARSERLRHPYGVPTSEALTRRRSDRLLASQILSELGMWLLCVRHLAFSFPDQ